jgi:uncharacterized protein (UPF0248 family)
VRWAPTRIVVLHHGCVRGERTVRATSHEEIGGLITGELGDQAAPAHRARVIDKRPTATVRRGAV